jgi:hypothetical protein
MSCLNALSRLMFSKTDVTLIASREFVDDSRMGTAIGPRSRFTCQMSHFPLFQRSRFMCGNGAPLFFTFIDYGLLLKVGSAIFRHWRLHSSRPMDFNKWRETSSIVYWRISQSWIVLPQFFWMLESAQGNPYERPRLTTKGIMQTARSATSLRKAR